MRTLHLSIITAVVIITVFLGINPALAQNSTDSQCMSQDELDKITIGPQNLPVLHNYKLQCTTKLGSTVYQSYVPNGTSSTNQQQEIPSTFQSPIQVLSNSGGSLVAQVNTGQSAQIPVKINLEDHYQFFSIWFSMENLPPHVQAWIDPRDSSFLDPTLKNGTVYIYVDSGAKAGSYDIPITAQGSIEDPSGNQTQLDQAPVSILHLTVSGNDNTWSDVGLPDIQHATICSQVSSGTSCSGFIAYEKYPITVYGQNQKVTMSAPDLPAGKYLRFIPDSITATPQGTAIKMITSGIVTPGAPNAISTPVVTIVTQSPDGSRATSYIQIAKTDNLTVINSPQPIKFHGNFGGDGETGNGIFGAVYDPSDYTSNPLPVKLAVLGMQNGNNIVPMPSWLSVSIPDSSFNLVPTIPYFFTIGFSSVNASIGTYPVAIGEDMGGSNFVQDVDIKIYQPVRMGPAVSNGVVAGPSPTPEYNVYTGSGSWLPLVGFGGIVGAAAVTISIFIMRKK